MTTLAEFDSVQQASWCFLDRLQSQLWDQCNDAADAGNWELCDQIERRESLVSELLFLIDEPLPAREFTVAVQGDTLKRLYALVGAADSFEDVEGFIAYLVHSADDGIRRPGAWEREWLEMAIDPDAVDAAEEALL